jgi:hypothetical protein
MSEAAQEAQRRCRADAAFAAGPPRRSLDDATMEEWDKGSLHGYQMLEAERARKLASGEIRLAPKDDGVVRTFETGATRSSEAGKPDYEGYFSPLVFERFGEYMMKHQKQADGTLRPSDNWQKGISFTSYIKSKWRHFMDIWKEHRKYRTKEGLEDALCADLFNTMGYLHETLKARGYGQ